MSEEETFVRSSPRSKDGAGRAASPGGRAESDDSFLKKFHRWIRIEGEIGSVGAPVSQRVTLRWRATSDSSTAALAATLMQSHSFAIGM